MAKVLFAPPDRLEQAVPKLIRASGFLDRLNKKQKLGVKLHFGEDGNKAHLGPELARAAVDTCRDAVAKCALIETTTLYRGRRSRARTHVELAHEHGFTLEKVGARVEIIDGDKGDDYYEVPVNLKLVKNARLGRKLKQVDALLNMAHFKGHMVTGFGGLFKNLAMGLAAKAGKLEMHSQTKPVVNQTKCTACEECREYCPHDAIVMVDCKAFVGENCVGCAGCLSTCTQGAMSFKWNEAGRNTRAKVVEYAFAVLRDTTRKAERPVLHMNFAVRITPNCDCMGEAEKPLMPDVGLFVSYDPVACEQAAYDRCRAALDKAWPDAKPEQMLVYAEELGLGMRKYELVELPA